MGDFGGNFPSSLALASGNGQLTALAQLIIVGVEFIAPILYSWINWDTTRERMAGRFDALDTDFDFIVGKGQGLQFHGVLWLVEHKDFWINNLTKSVQ